MTFFITAPAHTRQVSGVTGLFSYLPRLVVVHLLPQTYEVYGSQIDVIASKLVAKWPVIQEQIVDPLLLIKEEAIAAVPIGKEKSA